jgi:hypothetical protein
MAERNIFSRLKRLFSTNVIVRNVGGRSLKISDTNKVQAVARRYLTDRFTRLYSNMGYGSTLFADSQFKQTQRLGLFKDYETMDSDPIIASALDVYADESTMKSEYGTVLGIKTTNPQVHDILHNLFYDILNIEFNLWPWVRNLCKYGDFFAHLEVAEKYGIVNIIPLSAYDVIRVEGEDPENPHYVKFTLEATETLHSSAVAAGKDFENYEIAHFRLLSDSNYLPYGKSMLEGARKVWKQLTLMEDAMLIHRIMRAPEKRIFNIDIGNIPPAEVDNYMQRIINKMKKAPIIDEVTGDYNLKYNIQNLTEDFFMPVRGGDSGTSIDTLSGMEYGAIEDIEYLRNKMMAALRIPKAFLGYDEAVGSRATLAAEDVRFARTIERIQRITVSELTKIAIVHLYSQGYEDEDLVDFDLMLTNPSTIYEQEKIELWGNKVTLANDMKDNMLMPTEWIYDNIFNLSKEEKQEVRLGVIKDQKRKFRYEQIESEGNDPVQSGEAIGTPVDLASIPIEAAKVASEAGRTGRELNLEIPDDGWPGAGRPKEVPKYGKDGSARGRDPLGAHEMKKEGSVSPKYGMALAHFEALKKSLGKGISSEDKKIISESLDVEKEYEEEVLKEDNGSTDE